MTDLAAARHELQALKLRIARLEASMARADADLSRMARDIQAVRGELRESQRQFGKRFGVDQATIHRWETKGPPERGAARHAVMTFLRSYMRGSRKAVGTPES